DVVYTNYEANFNFGTNYTYSLPIAVVDLDASSDDDREFIDPDYSDAILDGIASHLNDLGWTKVDPENADIVILAGAFDQNFIAYNPWWWDWYYPWYGPDWG
ncbi:hypothetical protein HW561_23425, partial [Rhodobacteraceae bacterium B1Z28]|nr:hypothetical protein [Ruegeria haliotis]